MARLAGFYLTGAVNEAEWYHRTDVSVGILLLCFRALLPVALLSSARAKEAFRMVGVTYDGVLADTSLTINISHILTVCCHLNVSYNYDQNVYFEVYCFGGPYYSSWTQEPFVPLYLLNISGSSMSIPSKYAATGWPQRSPRAKTGEVPRTRKLYALLATYAAPPL